MKPVFPALACLALVAACVTPPTPIVSDYNGASVKIQAPGFYGSGTPRPEDIAEANRICGTAKKRAEYASTSAAGEYTVNHLFLCL
jgi:hypothetical protein